MPVVGLSGPRCLASAATSSVNFCFSFTTRSRPLCSHSRWRLFLDVVTWSDATKIGLRHRPNARYPAPLWLRSTRKDHNHTWSPPRLVRNRTIRNRRNRPAGGEFAATFVLDERRPRSRGWRNFGGSAPAPLGQGIA